MIGPAQNPACIAVIGEAVLDVEVVGGSLCEHAGGSPLNVAVGLARLGLPTRFVGRLSIDRVGQTLRGYASDSGVDLSLCQQVDQPSTVATVTTAADLSTYAFDTTGRSDFGWNIADLPALPPAVTAVHFGSLTSWLPPGCNAVLCWLASVRDRGLLVSYDPNLRPSLHTRSDARIAIDKSVVLADIVKASRQDLHFAYPARAPGEVASTWLDRGVELVVITDGAAGATAYTRIATVHRPSPRVDVIDTVGAGDAFTSGLIAALASRHKLCRGAVATAELHQLLDEAVLVAALTCQSAGANPPTAAARDARLTS